MRGQATNIALYADDTLYYTPVPQPDIISKIMLTFRVQTCHDHITLQDDIKQLYQWSVDLSNPP